MEEDPRRHRRRGTLPSSVAIPLKFELVRTVNSKPRRSPNGHSHSLPPSSASSASSGGAESEQVSYSSSDDDPIPQQTEESPSSSSLFYNETRQGQKNISISPIPILRHLGLVRAKSSSSNPNHTAEAPVHSFTSVSSLKTNDFTKDNLRNKEISYLDDKHKHFPCRGKSRRENVNNLSLIGVKSDVDPDYGSESPSLVCYVPGNKMKESTKGMSKLQTNETFEEQCSSVITVDNTNASAEDIGDEFSLPSTSFGKCKPDQAKRSKLKHANVKSPPGITQKDFTSDRTECNEESTLNIGQLQQHSYMIESNGSPENYLCHMTGYIDEQNDHCLPTSFGKKNASHVTRLKPRPANLKYFITSSKQKPNPFQKPTPLMPFDIFQSEHEICNSTEVIFAMDDEQGSELYQPGDHSRVLRPGMVLLKGFLNHDEQVSVARECRNLGLGPGGFYQPGYKYGAKLRLMMMCLGRDWDPQTRKYSNRRRLDNSRPPDIPHQFLDMVNRAMIASQALMEREDEENNVADILPMMLPDICIVNFYTTTGGLGLHQDRDESPESLAKGLPVVSISVGDSAEFLYGYDREIRKAEKLVLESGDVLIFGGQSRHIFHGVDSIIPGSAPEPLLKKTPLLPGRLNLTFRQF